jgi:hypothetical protein
VQAKSKRNGEKKLLQWKIGCKVKIPDRENNLKKKREKN